MTMDAPAPERSLLPRTLNSWVRLLICLVLAAYTAYYVARSVHWRLMVDSPVMHYVVFLMRHGFRPYADITDNNMPGAYLGEWAAMLIFGPTDLAWRLYEFFLLTTLTVSMVVIAKPYDWLAGVFAAGLFLVLHAAAGPSLAVEREELIACLTMASLALLFTAVRRRWPGLALLFGLSGGMAASIKPTFLLLSVVVLVLAALALRRRSVSSAPYVLNAVAGFALIGAAMLAFLLKQGVLHQFLFVLRTVTPAYRANADYIALAVRVLPKFLLPALPFALAAVLLARRSKVSGAAWGWERWAIFAGFACGLVSYFVQGKGFGHHRYVYLLCLFLLAGLELLPLLRSNGGARVAAVLVFALTLLFTVPAYFGQLYRVADGGDFAAGLQQDMQQLAAQRPLQRKVFCFDQVDGCLNVLYHLGLVESSGFTGDMLLFPARTNPAVEYYRKLFWTEAAQHPPEVLVVSNYDFAESKGFAKLKAWPQLDSWIAQNFTMVRERSFPHETFRFPAGSLPPGGEPGYRIYIRTSTITPSGKRS